MSRLFDRPPRGVIPISKGGDLVIDFQQKIKGVYTNYAAGVSVTLVIQTPSGDISSGPGTITGYHAVCKIESSDTDSVDSGAVWRCVVSYPTVPTTERVAMNGTIVRADS